MRCTGHSNMHAHQALAVDRRQQCCGLECKPDVDQVVCGGQGAVGNHHKQALLS